MSTQPEENFEEGAEEVGPFPKIRDLGQHGMHAADLLVAARDKLLTAGAADGAKRLERVDELVDKLDFAVLGQLVDPERTAEEFAAAQQRRLHRLQVVRNCVALAPLLVTWIALSWASIEYSRELSQHAGKLTQPFLLLWQHGFGGGIPPFSFWAFLDFVLLAFVLVLTYWTYRAERTWANRQSDVISAIDRAMDELAIAVNRSVVKPPASAQDWANSAKQIMKDAMESAESLAASSRTIVEQASTALAEIHAEGREFIETFSQTIAETLVSARQEYEQFMAKTALEVNEAIAKQMGPLLGRFDGLVTEFGAHHETYRAGVSQLTQGVSSMSQSAQVLADSARDHGVLAERIGDNLESVKDSQSKFADEVAKSVTSMASAAKAMVDVSEVLRNELQTGLKSLTDNVVDASRELKTVDGHLAETSKELAASTGALVDVTRELRAAARSLRNRTGTSGKRRWQFWR